jgi:hypothetical protein
MADELARTAAPSESVDDEAAAQTTARENETSSEGSIIEPLKGGAETTSYEVPEAGSPTSWNRHERRRSTSSRSSKEDPPTDLSIKSSQSFRASFVQGTSESVRHMRASFSRSSGSVADLTRLLAASSVTDPDLLGSFQCSAIVVNYISAGYILLPHGKFMLLFPSKTAKDLIGAHSQSAISLHSVLPGRVCVFDFHLRTGCPSKLHYIAIHS